MRSLPEDARTAEWISASRNPAVAAACARCALALNTLDRGWLDGLFADDVQYGSQQVFDIVHGRRPVHEHLAGKIERLRASRGRDFRFELARSPVFGECLAGFERTDDADRNWLARPKLTAVLSVNAAGRVASVMIVTVAPSPARVERSGIYPGIDTGTVHGFPQASAGTHN
jgi:hypothetical protein